MSHVTATGVALETRGLEVRHGGLIALESVNLSVHHGQIVGLIGPNGAGKTTFIDAVTGFVPLSRGAVELDGRDITELSPQRRSRLGLARTFQSGELFEDLNVRDNLVIAAHRPRWQSTLRDFGSPNTRIPDISATLDLVGLTALAERMPTELTHVERQLVALARALVQRPSVVVLDEPAAGLGVADTERLADMIAGLPPAGTSVVLVDHDMSLVMSTCNVVHVLDFGRVIAVGTPAEVSSDVLVRQAYLGARS